MDHHQPAASAFWSSKLGQAAIASIAAMVMMIALSSQIQPGVARAAPLAPPATGAAAIIEIA